MVAYLNCFIQDVLKNKNWLCWRNRINLFLLLVLRFFTSDSNARFCYVYCARAVLYCAYKAELCKQGQTVVLTGYASRCPYWSCKQEQDFCHLLCTKLRFVTKKTIWHICWLTTPLRTFCVVHFFWKTVLKRLI